MKYLIDKDVKNAKSLYHVLTKSSKIINYIHKTLISNNTELFYDKKLHILFNTISLIDDSRLNDVDYIWDRIPKENKEKKNGINLSVIDRDYLDKLYLNRQTLIDGNNDDKVYNYIHKLLIEKLKYDGVIPKTDNDDDDDDDTSIITDDVIKTSVLPDFVYENLPDSIKNMMVYIGNNRRKRDMFLISLFPTLSILFSNIQCALERNDGSQEIIKPNLYTFIVAEAGSGKGVLKHLNSDVLYRYNQEIEKYNERLKEKIDRHNQNIIKDKKTSKKGIDFNDIDELDELETEKEYKPYIPVIPGNISSAAFKKQLENNNGVGLMIETEVDNIVKNNRTEWGDNSELFRSAFHYETIADMRLGRGITYIQNPFISLAVSGTEDQLKKIFYVNNSLENGLFSRYIFYYNNEYDTDYNYFKRSLSGQVYNNNNNPIRLESNYLYDIHNHYRELGDLNMIATDEQIKRINNIISSIHGSKMGVYDDKFKSSFNRASLMIVKMAIILSIVRNGISSKNIFDMDADSGFDMFLNNIDIDIAGEIFKTLLDHIGWIYQGAKITNDNFKESKYNMTSDPSVNKVDILYKSLPKTFKKKELIEMMIKDGIIKNNREVDKYLKKWISNKLIEISQTRGYYDKIN